MCHIDKNLCTRSGFSVLCELSKWYKYVETKSLFWNSPTVLMKHLINCVSRAYELLK